MSAPDAAPVAAQDAAPARRAPPAWARHPWLRRVGSLKFAVVMILGFAAVMVGGLFYEGAHGTPAAQHHIYRAWWFNGMFVLLAANIAAAALVRYPWPKRLTGFVITHLGLLVLIAGTMVTRLYGIEGKLLLFEGEQADRIILPDDEVIGVQLPDGTTLDADAEGLAGRVGEAPRRLGPTAWAMAVAGYLPSSRLREWFEADPTGLGAPALQVAVRGGAFDEVREWLAPRDPRRSRWSLGPLAVYSWAVASPAERQWFRNLGRTDREYRFRYDLAGGDGEARLLVTMPGGGEVAVPLAAAARAPHPLADGVTIEVLARFANAVTRPAPDGTTQVEEAPEGSGHGPAVRVRVAWGDGRLEKTVWARVPDAHGGAHGAGDGEALPKAVLLALTPEGEVLARVVGPGLDVVAEPTVLRPGGAVQTPWNGISVALLEALPAARPRSEVEPAPPPEGPEGHAVPAVRLHLVGPGGEADAWVQRMGTAAAHHPAGHVRLRWEHRQLPLGFSVRLLDFRKGHDPGTMTAASYESDVMVDDPIRGRHEKVRIHMNYPLLHGGPRWLPGLDWAFYQESFEQFPDGRELSQLQVAYDPGYPIVSVGAILIVAGIFTMFYLVPYFQPGRRGAAPGGAKT
jgi:hypothetical protein